MLDKEYGMLVQYFRDLGDYGTVNYLEKNKKQLKPLLMAVLLIIYTVGSVVEAIASIPLMIWWWIVEYKLKEEIEWMKANHGKATLKLTVTGLHLVTRHGTILLLLAKQGASRIPAYLLEREDVKDKLMAVYNAGDLIDTVKYLIDLSNST